MLVPATINADNWLSLILVGGLVGAVGQSARTIVGLKKVYDEADAKNVPVSTLIDPMRLVVSLLIGFTAGVLAALSMQINYNDINSSSLLGIAAAGYTGGDFIEGIMSRYLPGTAPKPAAAAAPNSAPPDTHKG